MKQIPRAVLIEFFELFSYGLFAESCEVKTKDDLEWFSALLHEHLETAIQDYAMDTEIEDYDPQY